MVLYKMIFKILILSFFIDQNIFRLSKENVTSIYDDRLDKVDPDGNLQPGQRRYYELLAVSLTNAVNSICIL